MHIRFIDRTHRTDISKTVIKDIVHVCQGARSIVRLSYLRATMRKIDSGSDPNPGKFARGSLANWHMRSS